jgi:hypothetical protein
MRLGRGMATAAEEQELPVSNLMLGVILFCIVFGMCLTISLQHCWQRHRGASMQPSRKCKDTGRLCDSSEDEDRNSASGLVQSTGSAVRHTRKKKNARLHFAGLLDQIGLAYPRAVFQHESENDRKVRAHFSQACEGLNNLRTDLVEYELCKFCRKRSAKLIYEQMLPQLEKELKD